MDKLSTYVWQVWMKTERNLSDFFAEKRKRKGNMETEFCKTEKENFTRKRKQIQNGVFRLIYHGNGISVSVNTELSFFSTVCKVQSNIPNI